VDNPKELRHLGLCSGYGGIERGIELTGQQLRTLAHVEIEAYAVANLVAKMEVGAMAPCPIWTDLKTLPLAPFRGVVDLLTGGYPCQPFSHAGRRLGKDDPRHLWPWICRIIDGVMPRMCFFENVEGHITKGLQQVLSDLEARGYKTAWGVFSAVEAGASHQRKRMFIMAHSSSVERWDLCGQQSEQAPEELGGTGHDGGKLANPDNKGLEGQYKPQTTVSGEDKGIQLGLESGGPDSEAMANANSSRGREDKQPSELRATGPQQSSRSPRSEVGEGEIEQVQRWPSRPAEEQFDWERPRTIKRRVGRAADGTPTRVDQLRLLGNGVVPQTAAIAWKTLARELL